MMTVFDSQQSAVVCAAAHRCIPISIAKTAHLMIAHQGRSAAIN
ncbi:hypothetical protein [Microcoleus sp. LEGE 07076]|nr:hypothetical protein [Microcoleus sp. LEGE 07076]